MDSSTSHNLHSERVNSVEDVCSMGDEITVMVTDIDPQGKIRLSRQAVLEGWSAEEAREKDQRKPGGGRPGGGIAAVAAIVKAEVIAAVAIAVAVTGASHKPRKVFAYQGGSKWPALFTACIHH